MIEQYQSPPLHKASSGFSSFQTVQFPSHHAPSTSYFKISLDPKCERLASGHPTLSSKTLPTAAADSKIGDPFSKKRHLRKPRHPHDQPDENYLFRIFTPGEYDALRDADNTWRVTTSSDISGSWDGIPFAAEEHQRKYMGRSVFPSFNLFKFSLELTGRENSQAAKDEIAQTIRF